MPGRASHGLAQITSEEAVGGTRRSARQLSQHTLKRRGNMAQFIWILVAVFLFLLCEFENDN